jgi:hypothetical protein
MPVPVFSTVIVAPDIVAPVESAIEPSTVAVEVCEKPNCRQGKINRMRRSQGLSRDEKQCIFHLL